MFSYVSFGKGFCGTVLPGKSVGQEKFFFSGEKLTGP
jgi:hypothetical protein